MDVSTVTSIMSYKFAERHHILAVNETQDEVVIATAQPFTLTGRQDYPRLYEIRFLPVSLPTLRISINIELRWHNLAKSVSGAAGRNGGHTGNVTNFEQLLELKDLKNADANDQHIVNIVDWLLQYSFDQRASDIHMEPRRDVGNVRFRIDGVLHDVYEMPATVLAAVTSRIKILGRMNVAEKGAPRWSPQNQNAQWPRSGAAYCHTPNGLW